VTTFQIPTGTVDVTEGPVNLDCYPGDPFAFWAVVRFQPVRVARTMFPTRPAGYVKATRNLAGYAANVGAAQSCRLAGDIVGAQVYETICQSIYDRLPTFARW
jgi:hypothetical protein